MSKLVWDQIGERLYETGTKNGVLFVKADDGTYRHGVAWNGLTAVTESPSGADEQALYADDIKYLSLRAREEFGATIEAYTYPDEFAECDGSSEIAPGVIIGQQTRRGFGFAFKTVLGNDVMSDSYGYKLHLIYGATASPSERSYQTVNDSPEAITFSWEISTVPVEVTGAQPIACLTIDSTKADSAKLAELEKVLFGSDGEALASEPADWATNYANYKTSSGAAVAGVAGVDYEELTSEPEDWATNYTDYFTNDGSDYAAVTGDNAPTFASGTYYKAVSATVAPEFAANTYFTAGTESTLLLPDDVAAIMKTAA